MEDDAQRIDHAASRNQPEDGGWQRLHHGVIDHDAAPAERQIKQDRQPVKTPRHEQFEHDADESHAPHEQQQGQRAVAHMYGKRRVGSGNQQINRRMVETAQEPFGRGDRPDIVNGGNSERGNEARQIDAG